MKTTFFVVALCALGSCAEAQPIAWTTLEKAQALNRAAPKKYLVDVYTDWCVYCRKMDQTTFRHPGLVEFINANYRPVKFNAEQRADAHWNAEVYAYQTYGYRGFNQLAVHWLRGQMAFPTLLVISADGQTVEKRVLGFQTAEALKRQLKRQLSDN